MTVAPPAPPVPPVSPLAGDRAPQPLAPTSRVGARVIAVVMVVVGALVAVGTIAWAGVTTAGSIGVRTSERTVSADGVERLGVELAAADLRIEFARVDAVELQVTGRHGADRWTLDVDGDRLVVASGDGDVDLVFDHGDRAVLRLPRDLEGLDLELGVDAGDVSAEGAFGAVTLAVGAGDVEIDGTAESLDAQVDPGDVEVSLRDVGSAWFTVAAGDVSATLTGAPPATIAIDASAADVEVTVPRGRYALTGDALDGELVETDLVSDPGADSTIDVRSEFADVSISASR